MNYEAFIDKGKVYLRNMDKPTDPRDGTEITIPVQDIDTIIAMLRCVKSSRK